MGMAITFTFPHDPPISPSPLSLLRSRVCCPESVYMPKFLRLTLLKYCHHLLIPVNLLHCVVTLLVSRRKRLVFLPSRPTAHIRQVSTNEMVISITPAYPTGNNATWYYDQLVAPRTRKLCGLFFFFFLISFWAKRISSSGYTRVGVTKKLTNFLLRTFEFPMDLS